MPTSERIHGRHAVLEALRAGQPVRRVLAARDLPAWVKEQLDSAGTAVEWVSRAQLDRLARRHQGLVAELEAFTYASLEEILDLARRRGEPALVVVLDLLQDPQNLGSLLRTAEAVGAHGAVIQERRAAGVTAAVHRASAGAVAHLPIARQTNLVRALAHLKAEGLWIYGLQAQARQAYHQADLTGPLALVVGSEGAGLRRLVRESCDVLIGLPMRGRVASLNAAVAGSVVLYEAWRQRATAQAGSPTSAR